MKKITALLLTIAMFVSMIVPAYAIDTADITDIPDEPKVTLVNLSTKITTQELDKIMDSVGAKMVMEDGTVIPVDSVVTIEDVIEETSPYSVSTESSYRITVQADASDKGPSYPVKIEKTRLFSLLKATGSVCMPCGNPHPPRRFKSYRFEDSCRKYLVFWARKLRRLRAREVA